MLGIPPRTDATVRITLLIYSCGLVGMLAFSAYHLSRAGHRKERLRRIDHAAIFGMIAGNYTPFAVNTLARRATCTAASSALRKRDRSCLVIGAGPPVITPISRKCRDTSRPASALPILSAVHRFPLGASACARFVRQRAASGMSVVTQTSAGVIRWAIQLSAESGSDGTVIMHTFGRPLGRIGREPFETTKTAKPSRSATRNTSSRTGQASPST